MRYKTQTMKERQRTVNELTKDELRRICGCGTLVGNPGKAKFFDVHLEVARNEPPKTVCAMPDVC